MVRIRAEGDAERHQIVLDRGGAAIAERQVVLAWCRARRCAPRWSRSRSDTASARPPAARARLRGCPHSAPSCRSRRTRGRRPMTSRSSCVPGLGCPASSLLATPAPAPPAPPCRRPALRRPPILRRLVRRRATGQQAGSAAQQAKRHRAIHRATPYGGSLGARRRTGRTPHRSPARADCHPKVGCRRDQSSQCRSRDQGRPVRIRGIERSRHLALVVAGDIDGEQAACDPTRSPCG